MDEPLRYLADLRREYDRIYAAAGRDTRIGEPSASNPPPRCLSLHSESDGSHVLRVEGPMDPWYGGCYVPELIAELDEAKPTDLRVLIDSPGGLVFYGMALYSDLRGRARDGMALRCEVRGIAASAAVLPLLAADTDRRTMGDGAMAMVHNVWGGIFAVGDADQVERAAGKAVKALRALCGNYRDVLARRTGMTAAEAAAAMAAETWYTAAEAVEAGLAGAVADSDDEPEDPEESAALVARARLALSHFAMTHTRTRS